MSAVASFEITGRSTLPLTAENLATTMTNALGRFAASFNRLPTDDEIMMLWAAVQRYHGVPEGKIEPAAQRRWM